MDSQALDIYLIIGLTKDSRHWSEEFLSELKTHLSPAAIHLVDLPGAGTQLDKRSPATINQIVDEARKNLSFNPERRRLVIAISLGGMVAWDWVTRYGDDFNGFVMINSSLAGVSSMFKRLRPQALYDFLRIAASSKGERKEKRILELCSNHAEKSQKILPRWIEVGVDSTMHFPNVVRQLVAGLTFRPRHIPKLPMLVVAAQGDRLAHYSCSKDIAELTKAEFVLCTDKNVGHAFHVDGPDFLALSIKKWWQSQ